MAIGEQREEWMGALAWADDLILMTAHTNIQVATERMQETMQVALDWANECKTVFSTDEVEDGEKNGKTIVMVIGDGSRSGPPTNWKLGREESSLPYLGTILTNQLAHPRKKPSQ